ncbi:phenylalanine--tRNA ligase subunit beta [Carboxylicivirga mesophila]|uniref:Phenylalanine--tRNA ligase beta subunit n=1 Tax=Carboxylicivirga mesophila TaxID=1166478 RepID=A0ABS5K745_9BACT|nr:phenylalanine--tRNA ligase subunit beta [Carboxylicivirga mesophila]MBS2210816.1 phenylalanine--tRNA ligase subunit beta [Carboxylicivirga mesophila]
MNISYNWLKSYLNVDLAPEKISEILTDLGLEVGSMEEVQSIKGGLEGLVIGEVLTCEKHPNADKLSVTTVNIGNGEPLPIVCGAPNVAAGQKVVVATVGTVLYSGDESFTIKKSKIRGEQSMGMICAEDEIGLGTSHDGIMVLPAEVKVGSLAKDYFKVENDTAIEVDLTPNRVDGSSHYGVARDLAAYLKQHQDDVKLQLPSVDEFKVDNTNYEVKVTVENTEACPRYCGVTISDITIQESPEWLQNKLKAIGLSPINNVVDVTNFVLHEVGQPLHAFDGDEIKGSEVIVKTLADGTLFQTLDEEERELSENDLMICNAEAGMCIAGVFGGLKSGVSEKTTKVFLESAYFNPVWVRKTAKRHTLSTDASFRFERGVDPNMTIYALKRAALLIKEVAGGTISSEITDIYPTKIENFEVDVTYRNITRLIGKDLSQATIKSILSALDIDIINETEEGLKLSVPPYRVDVQREADIIEEILRVYGYNNIEMPSSVNSTIVYSQKPDDHKLKNTVANQLMAQGFSEIMCNSLTKASYYETLDVYPRQHVVELANPLSNDLNGMRQTLLFGGLESISHNINRRNSDLKLFEYGNTYHFNTGDKSDLNNYNETQRLAIFMVGNKAATNWNTPEQKVTFFDLKNQLENILLRLGLTFIDFDEVSTESDLFAESICLKQGDKVVADYGMVNGKLLKAFDIDVPVYFAEINWDIILKKSAKKTVTYTEIPKFPEVKRDLALVLNKDIKFEQVKTIAQKTEKKLLKRISLFDVFEGEKLGAGKKSYAVSFILQDESKTLNDKQIDKIMKKLMTTYENELGAVIRK